MRIPNRCGKRSMHAPARFESAVQGTPVYPKMLRPSCKAHGFTIKSYHPITSAITSLLRRCSPFAIFGAVAKVIVNSLDGVLGRGPISHVSKEHSEVVPLRTHSDTTTTVEWVGIFALAVHSLPRRTPRFEFKRTGHAVRNINGCHSFSPKTPTRNSYPPAKTVSTNKRVRTALADAQVLKSASLTMINRRNHSQSSKSLTREVFASPRKLYNFVDHLILQYHLIRWRSVDAGRTPIIPQGVT